MRIEKHIEDMRKYKNGFNGFRVRMKLDGKIHQKCFYIHHNEGDIEQTLVKARKYRDDAYGRLVTDRPPNTPPKKASPLNKLGEKGIRKVVRKSQKKGSDHNYEIFEIQRKINNKTYVKTVSINILGQKEALRIAKQIRDEMFGWSEPKVLDIKEFFGDDLEKLNKSQGIRASRNPIQHPVDF